MDPISDSVLEHAARTTFGATNFVADTIAGGHYFLITFPDMKRAADFAHNIKIRNRYRVGIHRSPEPDMDPFNRPITIWLMERADL